MTAPTAPSLCPSLRRTTLSRVDDWLLTAHERGNPSTDIDRRHPDGQAWTSGNLATPLVHGGTYFPRLLAELRQLEPGDEIYFTDWRGDADELLDRSGTALGTVLAELAGRKVLVRGLVWRSHPKAEKFSEEENAHLVQIVNRAGGQILLDERVKGPGCHHQKMVVIHHRDRHDDDIAFAGGIDLCHGRHDDERHLGDEQTIPMDKRFGPRPAWHDVQLEIRGPAVADIALTFRERWEDPTPLDHRNPLRAVKRRRLGMARRAPSLGPPAPDPAPAGEHHIQVLRTFPTKLPRLPYAPKGERSIARAYAKALWRARRLIYLEDQYLWSADIAKLLAGALRRSPQLHLIAVVPRFPDQDGRMSGPPNRIGQQQAIETVRAAGGARVAVYDIENEEGWPIYVHAKACVIDDVWASIGSDNLNRRSWTHDSELTCAILDETRDQREPRDPAGIGDGARKFARDLRLLLWREHLGREAGDDDDLIDPLAGFAVWRRSAERLAAWHDGGRSGPRPPGGVLPHNPGLVKPWAAWWASPLYRTMVDPDGRPMKLQRSGKF